MTIPSERNKAAKVRRSTKRDKTKITRKLRESHDAFRELKAVALALSTLLASSEWIGRKVRQQGDRGGQEAARNPPRRVAAFFSTKGFSHALSPLDFSSHLRAFLSSPLYHPQQRPLELDKESESFDKFTSSSKTSKFR